MGPDDKDDVLSALNAGEDDAGLDSGAGGIRDDGKMGDLADKVEEPLKKLSIRDSIKDAIKQEAKSPEEKTEERNRNLEKAREVRKLKRSVSEVDTNKDVSHRDTSEKGVDKVASTPKTDVQPPNGWTKEAKADWAAASEAIKQSVAKREKEVSEGFKQYGDKAKKYDEIDAVLAPRRAAIQRFGVSEAQTIDRLFQWMEALTGPNKTNSWLALGQNFGIDTSELAKKFGNTGNTTAPTPQAQQPRGSQIPDEVKSYVEGTVGQVTQMLTQQRQEAANEYLGNWAKDKPHFTQVRTSMYGLLNSGAIPLKDGKLDLDTAYDYACNADPTIRAELNAKAQETADAKAAEDRKQSEADRIIRLNKAKQASVSIRPTAPTAGVRSAKPGKMNGPPPSARDSIKDAIAELVSN